MPFVCNIQSVPDAFVLWGMCARPCAW